MRTQLSWRSYHYAILGACCGLLSWYIFGTLSQKTNIIRALEWRAVAVRGAVFGALVGFACSAYDGLRSLSLRLLARNSLKGTLLGLIAGAPAFMVAEALYGRESTLIDYRFPLAIFCWISLAAMIGLAEGIISGVEQWKAVVGACVGGAVGGLFYEYFGRQQSAVIGSSAEQTWQAIAFTVLGACIAAGISLISTILSDAWLEIVSGKLNGEKRGVSKFVDPGSKMTCVLGSNNGKVQIYLPGDPYIAGQHATISFVDNAPTLSVLDEALQRKLPSLLNGRAVTKFPLAPGDRIRLGGTEMVFHAKRVAKHTKN
jgi:hypothetical protein